jgi:hypothetical protein
VHSLSIDPRARALGAALLVAVAAACGPRTERSVAPDLDASPAGGVWAGNVTAEAVRGALRVGNNTTRPVGYAVFAREVLPVIRWAPCTERSGCPSVAPGERLTIPGSDITGLRDGRGEVVLYWWHLVEGRDGRLQPDSVREVGARL